jgi:gamma-glutamylcyclotransferase (GGCT)/AIG2-like uncharacterized protein YtfP
MVLIMPYLFVYGKLKKSQDNAMSWFFQQNATFVCEAYVKGRLYNILDYPGLVIDVMYQSLVYGEIYKLMNDEILNKLDEFEEAWPLFGEDAEYKRIEIEAIANNTNYTCQIYIYNWPIDESKRIVSGKW